ncbi:MAG: CPBP family intramembrane glutamic endopeptidase [Acidobacteriota bacterium]
MKSPTYFFQGVHIVRLLGKALILGVLAAVVHTVADLKVPRNPETEWTEIFRYFYLFGSSVLMGLIFAEKMHFQPFLVSRPIGWGRRMLALLLFGVGPGLLIGLVYHNLFAWVRFSPRRPAWTYLLTDWSDTLVVSLSSGFTEELVFRFLLFVSFIYVLSRLFHPVIAMGPAFTATIPFLFGVILSSLLFGAVHGTYGFLTAFLAGALLCLCFYRGGLESAVVAHVLANFVFFSLTYL